MLACSFAIKLHYIQKGESLLLAEFIVHNEAFVLLLKNICFGLTREKKGELAEASTKSILK